MEFERDAVCAQIDYIVNVQILRSDFNKNLFKAHKSNILIFQDVIREDDRINCFFSPDYSTRLCIMVFRKT